MGFGVSEFLVQCCTHSQDKRFDITCIASMCKGKCDYNRKRAIANRQKPSRHEIYSALVTDSRHYEYNKLDLKNKTINIHDMLLTDSGCNSLCANSFYCFYCALLHTLTVQLKQSYDLTLHALHQYARENVT